MRRKGRLLGMLMSAQGFVVLLGAVCRCSGSPCAFALLVGLKRWRSGLPWLDVTGCDRVPAGQAALAEVGAQAPHRERNCQAR